LYKIQLAEFLKYTTTLSGTIFKVIGKESTWNNAVDAIHPLSNVTSLGFSWGTGDFNEDSKMTLRDAERMQHRKDYVAYSNANLCNSVSRLANTTAS
jgi:hypothetical protein